MDAADKVASLAMSKGNSRLKQVRSTGRRPSTTSRRKTNSRKSAAALNLPKPVSPHRSLNVSLAKGAVMVVARELAKDAATASPADAGAVDAADAATGANVRTPAIKLASNTASRMAGNAVNRSATPNRTRRDYPMHRSLSLVHRSPLRSLRLQCRRPRLHHRRSPNRRGGARPCASPHRFSVIVRKYRNLR